MKRVGARVGIIVALAGCGGPSCPDGFVQQGTACVAPPQDVGAPALDAARMDAALDAALDATATAGPDSGPRPDVGMVESPDARSLRADGGEDAPLPDAFVEGCTPVPFYADADGDGFGNAGLRIDACAETLPGYSRDATDCDDGCASCRPGGTEICDGLDQDCSGAADEGLLSVFYADCDRDGFVAAGAMSTAGCAAPASGPAACPSGAWISSPPAQPDCDDSCAACRPGGTEVCDGADQDCDTTVDEGVLTTFVADCDGDDYTPTGAASTMACTTPATGPASCPSGRWRTGPSASADCNDTCMTCRPGGTEVCDGLDQDCVLGIDNGVLVTFVADCDRDGYTASGAASTMACTAPASGPASCASGGWRAGASASADCNDTCMTCRPGGTEVCDGLDQDCVGGIDNGVLLTFYTDCDGDTFTPSSPATTMACSAPSSAPPGCPSGAWRSAESGMPDCYDTNANVRPNQTAYFTMSSGRPALPYDYNCDGAESQLYTSTSGTCPTSVPMGMPCGHEGYQAGTAPQCNELAATYVYCTRGSCFSGNCLCNRSTSMLRQECR